jgi:hypothetical protein
LHTRKYVFPCFFADEIDDWHDLIAADDRVSHVEEVAILKDFLFGPVNYLHQQFDLSCDSVLGIEIEHEADAFMKGGWDFFESNELVQLDVGQLHLRWGKITIHSTTQFMFSYE